MNTAAPSIGIRELVRGSRNCTEPTTERDELSAMVSSTSEVSPAARIRSVNTGVREIRKSAACSDTRPSGTLSKRKLP